MKVNCDLGESYGNWQMGQDDKIMPLIDMANIACGFHASDPVTMAQTLSLAKQHEVSIGAHPSYPDLMGFGRRSMSLSKTELKNIVHYQISALIGMAAIQGLEVSYVKPHGALYNDMMNNLAQFEVFCEAIAELPKPLSLVIQAIPNNAPFCEIAKKYQIPLLFEAFIDRQYQDNGLLTPRSHSHASINDLDLIKRRSKQFNSTGTIESMNGVALKLKIDTVCIHGDHPLALDIAKIVRQEFNE